MRIWLTFAFLFMLPVTAAAQWWVNGERVEGRPEAASDGTWGVQLILVPDAEKFFAEWDVPGEGVNVTSASEVNRGGTITAVLIFNRCTPDPSGNCHLAADYLMVGPDGSVYADHKGAEMWRGPPGPPNMLQAGAAALTMRMEEHDLTGIYKVSATVHDRIAGKSLSVSQEFTATE